MTRVPDISVYLNRRRGHWMPDKFGATCLNRPVRDHKLFGGSRFFSGDVEMLRMLPRVK